MNARIENYLKAYNLVQLIGWLLAILIVPVDISIAFYVVCAVQILSLLEIFHAYKKWNNSSVLFCFLQVGARLMVLKFVALLWSSNTSFTTSYIFTKENLESVLHIMFITWCVAEVIRYAFYLSLFYKEIQNKFLWLRYNAFIICYPIGLICEFYILINVFIVSNSTLKIILVLIFIVYAIAFPILYLHLLKQRKTKLIKNN